MQFKDYFSQQADEYALRRPRYPHALFEWLASISPARDLAWDCGTGNGQAATGLAEHFAQIIATDASADQLRNAFAHPNVEYRLARAEDSGLGEASIDLVTVAQAVHWFDLDAFYAEVKRVLRPNGVLAIWSYPICHVSPEIDPIMEHFYYETVGPYWPRERVHVDDGYKSLPFPFHEIEAPPFTTDLLWDLADLGAYLRTWSPVRRYVEAHNTDPVLLIEDELKQVWGDPTERKQVRFPLNIRVGHP